MLLWPTDLQSLIHSQYPGNSFFSLSNCDYLQIFDAKTPSADNVPECHFCRVPLEKKDVTCNYVRWTEFKKTSLPRQFSSGYIQARPGERLVA